MDCLSYGYLWSGTSDNDSIFLFFDVDLSIKIGKKIYSHNPFMILKWSMFLFRHRASAAFLGVYEPTKQKLLRLLPENLSAVAHLVRKK